MDEEYKLSTKCVITNILINLQVQGDLYETIDLVYGTKWHAQVLDYINFQCQYVGHLHEDCSLNRFIKKWVHMVGSGKTKAHLNTMDGFCKFLGMMGAKNNISVKTCTTLEYWKKGLKIMGNDSVLLMVLLLLI